MPSDSDSADDDSSQTAPSKPQQDTETSVTFSDQTDNAATTPSSLGGLSTKFSDLVNDNLLAARYAGMATVGLLAAYGMAHTPLFSRHRTISELPARYFRSRKTLRCRLIQTSQQPAGGSPIVCQVRHLSPMEQVVPKSWYDWMMRYHPAAAVTGLRPDERSQELLMVQIAGLEAPPDYFSYSSERPGEWLERLAKDKTLVTCKLLGRRVCGSNVPTSKKRKLQDVGRSSASESSSSWNDELIVSTSNDELAQIAVVKMFYRPKVFQVWPTDIAESMIRFGRASIASKGIYVHNAADQILDTSDSVRDLQRDAAYMDKLGQLEYKAAAGSYGMWGDSTIRESRSDVVEEVEFQKKAPIWRKLWRWLRGG